MSKVFSSVFAVAMLLVETSAAAAVTGTVISRGGAPLANARVSAYRLESREDFSARIQSADPTRTPIATVATNARGAFSLDVKAEPLVEIAAEADGFAPNSMRAFANEELGTLALTAAESRRGRITAAGKAVPNATVVWNGSGTFVTRTDKDGYYSVPNPAKWDGRLIVSHPDFALYEAPLRFGATEKTVDVSLTTGTAISGKALRQDGTAASGAKLFLDGWLAGQTSDEGSFVIAHAPKSWRELWIVSGDQIAAITSSSAKPSAVTARLARAARVTGAVRDGKSQRPLGRVPVSIFRTVGADMALPPVSSVVSALDGSFTATLPPGVYQYAVNVPGYSFDTPDIALKPGQTVTRAVLGTPLGGAAGTVFDENRRPVPGAIVSLRASQRSPMMRMRMMSTGGPEERVTGPDGRFVLRGVFADVDVVARARKKSFPNAESGSFRVAAGERKSGLTITIPQGIALSGKVTDLEGHPLSGVAIAASESEGDPRGGMVRRIFFMDSASSDDAVTTAGDGTFTIRLKEGRYDLSFRRSGFATRSVPAVEVKKDVEPLAIQLDPGVEISGRVVRAGAGVDGVHVMAFSDANRASAITGPDGSFSLVDLSPGTFSVSVDKPDDFIRETRRLKAPARDILIDLPGGGRISGRVIEEESGNPVTDFSAGFSNVRAGGGMVMVAPPSLRMFHSDDGSFVLENVPADLSLQLVVNAPGFAPYKESGVRLEAGKTIDVTAAVEPGAMLAGHVTSTTDGAPLAGVGIVLIEDAGPMARFSTDETTTTDVNGDYSLDSLAAGEVTFEFAKEGYERQRQTVKLESKANRLDVRLAKGAALSGTVITESGAPIADARVVAEGAGPGGSNSATTDANGAFRIEGLQSSSRYSVSALKRGLIPADVKDVDASTSGPLRLVLRSGGRITGHVTGLSDSELERASVTVRGAEQIAAGAVSTSGDFVVEGVPSGTVTVFARTGSFGDSRSSGAKTVEMPDGGTLQVDLEFRTDTLIRGVVTRAGKPDTNATVVFAPLDPAVRTNANTSTDSSGTYEARGLDAGEYEVRVFSMPRMVTYSTKYTVLGSGTFDIDVRGAAVSGTVVDVSTGEPLNEATVSLGGAAENELFGRAAPTDATGRFSFDFVEPGNYRGRAEKPGYGQQIVDIAVDAAGASGVEFKLAKQEGAQVKTVDGRDNRPLTSVAILAYDASGRIAGQAFDKTDANGVTSLGLSPGTYRLRVSVFGRGYSDAFLSMTVPSPQITVGLTPGGSLVTSSADSQPRAAKILTAAGDNAGTIDPRGDVVRPGETTFENLAPGSYRLVLFDSAGKAVKTMPFSIAEGQTTRVEVK